MVLGNPRDVAHARAGPGRDDDPWRVPLVLLRGSIARSTRFCRVLLRARQARSGLNRPECCGPQPPGAQSLSRPGSSLRPARGTRRARAAGLTARADPVPCSGFSPKEQRSASDWHRPHLRPRRLAHAPPHCAAGARRIAAAEAMPRGSGAPLHRRRTGQGGTLETLESPASGCRNSDGCSKGFQT